MGKSFPYTRESLFLWAGFQSENTCLKSGSRRTLPPEDTMAMLLMPKATAVWLVDNTPLTFDQIAEFCRLHPLEVKGIADGEVASGIKGYDPLVAGQLTRDELERAIRDPQYRMHVAEPKVRVPDMKRTKGPRYTPVSKRQDRPNAILWLIKSHPELKDAQIMRLVGTTKTTIASVKERTHWNANNLTPMDPVTLGLCSQLDLDFEVQRAAKERPAPVETGATLLPASVTTADEPPLEPVRSAASVKKEEDQEIANVFAKLKELK